jgi:hypothetical protein
VNEIMHICEVCGIEYGKPSEYSSEKYQQNVFFRWSTKFCDKHRKEKETEALKFLPKILEVISKKNSHDT